MDDIVADLDRWLEPVIASPDPLERLLVMRRARDEIVALRKGVASGGWVWEQLQMTHKAARAEERERCEIAIHRCPALTSSAKVVAVAAIRDNGCCKE